MKEIIIKLDDTENPIDKLEPEEKKDFIVNISKIYPVLKNVFKYMILEQALEEKRTAENKDAGLICKGSMNGIALVDEMIDRWKIEHDDMIKKPESFDKHKPIGE